MREKFEKQSPKDGDNSESGEKIPDGAKVVTTVRKVDFIGPDKKLVSEGEIKIKATCDEQHPDGEVEVTQSINFKGGQQK